MATRGRPPKVQIPTIHPDAIMVKLDTIEKILENNRNMTNTKQLSKELERF